MELFKVEFSVHGPKRPAEHAFVGSSYGRAAMDNGAPGRRALVLCPTQAHPRLERNAIYDLTRGSIRNVMLGRPLERLGSSDGDSAAVAR
jgi:hypothetical protein